MALSPSLGGHHGKNDLDFCQNGYVEVQEIRSIQDGEEKNQPQD
jgi:hypothetical protein